VGLWPNGTAAALLQGDTVLLHRYTATGQPLPTLTYRLSTPEQPFAGAEREWPGELLYHDGKYFTYWLNQVVWLAESGSHRMHVLPIEVFQLVRSPYAAALSLAAVSNDNFLRWEPLRSAHNIPQEQLAADDATLYSLCFVSATHLVGLSTHHTTLYELGPNGAQVVRQLELPNRVAALPTSHCQQFALLKSTGQLTLHQLGEE
jgi:hypothetical protein